MPPKYVLKNFKQTDYGIQGEIDGFPVFYQMDGLVRAEKLYEDVEVIAETHEFDEKKVEFIKEKHKLPEVRADVLFELHDYLDQNEYSLTGTKFDFDFTGKHFYNGIRLLSAVQFIWAEGTEYSRILFPDSFCWRVWNDFKPLEETLKMVKWSDKRIKGFYEFVKQAQEMKETEIVRLYYMSEDIARAGNLSENPLILLPILQELKEKRIKPEEFVLYLHKEARDIRSHMFGGSSISVMFRDRPDGYDDVRASHAKLIDSIANTLEKMLEEGLSNKEN